MTASRPGIRPTPSGKYEATINHPSLPKGRVTRNFDTFEEAAEYKARRLEELRSGMVLPELKKAPLSSVHLPQLLRAYLNADTSKISKTDRPTVEWLQENIKITLSGLTTSWIDGWVRDMKRVDRLAPGTIRKKVESLARAVDWWYWREYQTGNSPPNPLRALRVGYSTYDEADAPGAEFVRVDRKRDRRLLKGEYEAISATALGAKAPDRERAWAPGGDEAFEQFFRFIVGTGLRLREAYRVMPKHVRLNKLDIMVTQSKTGAAREVPMTEEVEAICRARLKVCGQDALFPYWNGSDDEVILAKLSNRLSARFRSLFRSAGCDDLTEHDLRHEATCRWMEVRDPETGGFEFRPEEVRRITGHKNVQMFERYLSMRGEDFAHRLRKKKPTNLLRIVA